MGGIDHRECYKEFKEEVASSSRYFLSDKALDFLEWLLAEAEKTAEISDANTTYSFYRARRGEETYAADYSEEDNVNNPGYSAMSNKSDYFPRSSHASCNRASPEGIPFLYVATHPFIAVSEVRPNLGESVSVATLCSKEKMKVANFSLKGSPFSFSDYRPIGGADLDIEHVTRRTFEKISTDFSKPVVDGAGTMEYLPTQIIAEYLAKNGFDGIAYRTQFDPCEYHLSNIQSSVGKVDEGYNIVFFDKSKFYAKEAKIYRLKKTVNFIDCDPIPSIQLKPS